jgi:inositol phosphorylceramide glucuronosyltransferase 1
MLGRLDNARYRPGEAEQAFLNLYFGADVIRLPYVYNANLAIRERRPAIWYAVRDEIRIAHYTSRKPFAKDSKDIVDGAPLERLISKVRHHRDGMPAEAIG